jgi:hypothetical protein
MIWQSKQVLKSQKVWQKPNRIKNRPKGMSLEDWQTEVKEWKMDKLVVLDKVPKTRRADSTKRADKED